MGLICIVFIFWLGYYIYHIEYKEGRQHTGYEKKQIFSFWLIDCYILRFKKGAYVPPHIDPIKRGRHFRLNIILQQALGGEFIAEKTIIDTKWVKLFRPDLYTHSVTTVREGTRYVLSIGFRTL